MKTNNETLVKNETVGTVTNQSVASILEKLDKENPAKAEITLAQLEKQTGLTRGEVVQQVRHFRGGKGYIVGRKGRESRWTNKPTDIPQHHSAPKKNAVIDNGSELKFRLSIGGQEILIPLSVKTELVAA